jgi:hypothetical protein
METLESDTGPGKRFFIVDEELLRQKIVELSPQIRRDTNRMEDMIGELVQLDREKAGLTKHHGGKGTLELCASRRNPQAPDFSGQIRVSGKTYQVNAYVGHNQQFINLTFSPA